MKQHLSLPVSENNREKVLNAKDADGYTALHYAAKFNRFNILKLLWEAGASELWQLVQCHHGLDLPFTCDFKLRA